jgi:hypothetical protein
MVVDDDDDDVSEEEHVQPPDTEQAIEHASASTSAEAFTPTEHAGEQPFDQYTPGTNHGGTGFTPGQRNASGRIHQLMQHNPCKHKPDCIKYQKKSRSEHLV